jgi:hypothetical protein
MLRWGVLIGSFSIWLGCMGLVFWKYQAQQTSGAVSSKQHGLDAIFSDDAELQQSWHIFLDLRRLEAAEGVSVRPWSGMDESNLAGVGWIHSNLKKRENDVTRCEQTTRAQIIIPSHPKLGVFQLLGTITLNNRSDISLDHGLEVTHMTVRISGMNIEGTTHGIRDGEALRITKQLFQGRTKIMDERDTLPLGDKDAPTLELTPFQLNRKVNKGYTWEIEILDFNSLDMTGASKPSVTVMKARCTGKRMIKLNGQQMQAFEVETEDGKARAWYSADGVVVKQAFKFADTLEIVLVRADPKAFAVPVENK